MIVRSIELRNFRNYDNQLIKFGSNINVLIGKNAQGKTNILEGVFMCAIGKSPRTNKEKEMIKWESDFSKITVEVEKSDGQKKIELFIFKDQNKTIKINGIPIKKMGELMGNLNAIYFSPDELKLVKESPDQRRKFMDIDLCQFDKNYFYNLNKYNQILNQRNKLLKTTKSEKVLKDTIYIWNEQLATIGAKLIIDRIKLIEKLKVYCNNAQQYLTSKKEKLDLSYVGMTGSSEEEIKEKLMAGYDSSLEKDMSVGYTTVGPHRDDIKITVNDIDIRHFGSQGQQRTVALSLKLGELDLFKERLGEYPVLLLDDVLSELDYDRQTKLLDKVRNIQTIITCTDFDFRYTCDKFNVVGGKIQYNEYYPDKEY